MLYIWHTTICKVVHPLFSKNMKGPMQIKRDKYYSLMLLSKNKLHKLKNQINKVPTISKQDDIDFFSKRPCLSTLTESTSESSPVKMRPTKSVPREIDFDFLPPGCALLI